LETSALSSSATTPFDAFLFWHIPGQRGKKSDPQIAQISDGEERG
jgi:hypothetical protein